jgi:type II secretory pathway pseudopilin PulG
MKINTNKGYTLSELVVAVVFILSGIASLVLTGMFFWLVWLGIKALQTYIGG